MFINRKSRKLSRNQIFNLSEESVQAYRHKEVEIISFPVLEYIFGLLLIGLSIYFVYSAAGGVNGIKGFQEQLWWQFLCAVIPFCFGIGFIIMCQIEGLMISRKQNWIITTKTRFFCFRTEEIKKQFADLIGLSVVKNGDEKNNISMTNYHIILSFKTCDQLQVLRCVSSTKILQYFQELRKIFSHDEISQKRVVVQNLVS